MRRLATGLLVGTCCVVFVAIFALLGFGKWGLRVAFGVAFIIFPLVLLIGVSIVASIRSARGRRRE